MAIYRVTYRVSPGVRRLLEDVHADRHDVQSNWHVLSELAIVIGAPRWICALRVHSRDVVDVRNVHDLHERP